MTQENDQTQHTPVPWEVNPDGLSISIKRGMYIHPNEPRIMTEQECEAEEIEPCDDYFIADCGGHICSRYTDECEANARYIVQACNAHHKLVKALQTIAQYSSADFPGCCPYGCSCPKIAMRALKEAGELCSEGEKP